MVPSADTLLLLFYNFVVPVAVAGTVLLLASRPWSKFPGDAPGNVAGVLAFAAAFIAGDLLVRQWFQGTGDLFPAQAANRLSLVALASFLFGGAAASEATPDWLRVVLRGIVAAFTAGVLLTFMVENYWTPSESAGWLFGLIVGIAVLTTLASTAVEDQVSLRVPIVFGVLAAGTGALLSIYASKTLAQMAGVCGAALLPFVVLAWRRRHSPANVAVIDAAMPVLMGLLLLGHFLVDPAPPTASTVLVALVPLTLMIDRVPKLATAPRLALDVATVVLAVLLVAAAVAIAYVGAPAPPEPYYG